LPSQFIIEGLLTTVVGCIAPWFVHDFPTEKPRFLTEPQRLRVLERLYKDTGVANTAKFSWRQVKIAILDYKTPLYMLIYIGVAEPIYSQSLFSPTIVAALGKWTRSQSLLLTTPRESARRLDRLHPLTLSCAFFSSLRARLLHYCRYRPSWRPMANEGSSDDVLVRDGLDR
jgi:hypothetical protein